MKQLIFILIALISYQSFSQIDQCDFELSFEPAGLYYDSESDTYKEGLQLGTLEMSIDIESCKFNSRNRLLNLKARVFDENTYTTDPSTGDTIQENIPFIKIFKAIRQEGDLIKTEVLDETDQNGLFELKTKLNDQEKIYFETVGFTIYQLNIE